MTRFNLPDLGEGLAEAEIVRWHVKVGDMLAIDQPMVAVETAKAVVEVPSPFAGKVTALHGQPGDTVATGAPLIDIEVGATGTSAAAQTGATQGAGPRAPSTQPAGTQATAPRAEGGTAEHMPEDPAAAASPGGGAQMASESEPHATRVRAAPAVRALAKRMGVDLASIRGTGRSGLVTADDVMNASPASAAAGARAGTAGAPSSAAANAGAGTGLVAGANAGATSQPHAAQAGPGSAPGLNVPEKLRGLRRAMAMSMAAARDQVVSCTLFDDADLARWREGNDYTTRLLRAIAAGCAAEPGLNAWFDGDAQTRTLHSSVDVGMAVDTREGLIVPVVRNVGGRSPEDLRAEVNRVKRAAQDRTLAPEEMRDYTIMLTNFGMTAGRNATPVVVPPAVAILGAGRLSHDVVAVTGGIEAHLRLPLSLTFDHRCITGGEAARFLAAVLTDLQRTL